MQASPIACRRQTRRKPTWVAGYGILKARRDVNGMRTLAVVTAFAAALSFTSCSRGEDNAIKLKGAGATLPAPLYLKWFKDYNRAHPNIQVDYQPVGSGSGVKSFMERTVDFAASDAAMKAEDM